MLRRPVLLVSLLLVVLAGAGAAVLVLDGRAKASIAEGVRVGDVDVGGLTPAEARARLQRELLAPLDAPVVVRHGDRRFRLTARTARIRADIASMVADAERRSERGGTFRRAWRELTGGRVEAQLPARVSFSRPAVERLVTRVENAINRPARDAEVSFSGSGLERVAGQTGRAVRAQALEDAVLAAVVRPGARRTLVARTRTVRPEVTTDDLAERYPTVITVDRASFRLRLFKGLEEVRSYGIAVGQAGLETPQGLYRIENMAVNPAWHVPDSEWAGDLAGKVIAPDDPQNPIEARWMGIYAGAGIHGTTADSSIGTAASHGCIRMRIPDVIDLYDRVAVATPVYIA